MNLKMKDFADYYLESGNIYHSAIKAGYSENYAKTNASRLLEKDSVKKYIDERLASVQSKRIADIAEIMEYLTKGMRQELEEEVIYFGADCDGGSTPHVTVKKISIKDSNKCAELLAKRYGLLTENVKLNGSAVVQIVDDLGGGADGG